MNDKELVRIPSVAPALNEKHISSSLLVLYADRQTPNKTHNQSKPRMETILRGNKRNRGLCGRNNEAAISTAAFSCGSLIMLLYVFYEFI